jgi:hypothetical protein
LTDIKIKDLKDVAIVVPGIIRVDFNVTNMQMPNLSLDPNVQLLKILDDQFILRVSELSIDM